MFLDFGDDLGVRSMRVNNMQSFEGRRKRRNDITIFEPVVLVTPYVAVHINHGGMKVGDLGKDLLVAGVKEGVV